MILYKGAKPDDWRMNLLSGRQQIETGSWTWLRKWHQQCSKSALFPQQVLRHLFLQEEEVAKCLRYCFLAASDVCNNIPHPTGHLPFLSGSSFLSFISLRSTAWAVPVAVPRWAPSGWPQPMQGKAVQGRPPASVSVCQPLNMSQGGLGRTRPLNKASALSAVHFK